MLKYSTIILALLSCACAYGQADSMRMIHFSMENGLPSNHVYCILQDRNGYMWFSTENGLARYDGYGFRVFNTSNGLPSNDVMPIQEDSRGRIWLGSFAYEQGYIKDGVYRKINFKPQGNIVFNPRFVEADGKILFSYFSGDRFSIIRVDTNDNITTETVKYAMKPYVMDNGDVVIEEAMNHGIMYKGITKNGRLSYRKVCDSLRYFDLPYVMMLQNIGNTIHGYSQNGRHIHVFDLANCTQQFIDIKQYGAESRESIFLFALVKGEQVLLTNKAIYLLDKDLQLKYRQPAHKLLPVETQISYYLPDNSGKGWYATTTEGVWMQTGQSPAFRANSSLSVLAHSVYVGCMRDGTSFWWDNNRKKLSAVSPDLKIRFSKPFDGPIATINQGSDSLLYVSFSEGFKPAIIYNVHTHRKSIFLEQRDRLVLSKIDNTASANTGNATRQIAWERVRDYRKNGFLSIHEHAPGKYVSTSRGGSGVTFFQLHDDYLEGRQISDDLYPNLLFDSLNNKYWAYNKGKIFVADPDSLRWVAATHELLGALNINSITRIVTDRFYNFYILTDKRLIVFNSRLKRLRDIPVHMSLQDAFIEVYKNKLLLAGKFGIAHADINGPLAVSSFQVAPNVKDQYYKHMFSFTVNGQGHIIATTDKGVYTPHIDELTSHQSGLSVSDKNLMSLVVRYPHEQAVDNNDTIYLSQLTDKISFDFINMYGSGRRVYTYKIAGLPGWEQTESGEVFLSQVKPEKYYKVSCVVKDDIWKSGMYTFYIYKLPYWYQTSTWRTVFWVCSFLLLGVIVLVAVLVTRYYVARANEKKQQLTDLELRAIYSQINPHFIFNSLNSAQYFISGKKMEEAYDHVSKFSKLLRAYLKSSRNRYITLAEEIAMLKSYIELQQTRFREKFDYRIDIENKVPVNSVQIPSLLLQPLVENAINHGLFHLPEGKKGLLSLRFYQGMDSDELICTIEDNGIGREKAREIKKSVSDYESYGTKLTQELIDVFKQYEQMNIGLEYIDKQPPETGTIVKLTIRNLKYAT